MVRETAASPRADARRNCDAILCAAKAVFAEDGTEAPARQIAERAGVGIGTLYRHFPGRADLVAAVFAKEMDRCAASADVLAAAHPPFEAFRLWIVEFEAFVATKRGLAKAIYSGDPAYSALPARWETSLMPAFGRLFEAAVGSGEMRGDLDPQELMNAIIALCLAASQGRTGNGVRPITLLIDGLRHGTSRDL